MEHHNVFLSNNYIAQPCRDFWFGTGGCRAGTSSGWLSLTGFEHIAPSEKLASILQRVEHGAEINTL